MSVDAVKMHSERNWDQEKFSGLMQQARRIHFDHFNGVTLKPQRRKQIRGVWHVWKFGKWRKESPHG